MSGHPSDSPRRRPDKIDEARAEALTRAIVDLCHEELNVADDPFPPGVIAALTGAMLTIYIAVWEANDPGSPNRDVMRSTARNQLSMLFQVMTSPVPEAVLEAMNEAGAMVKVSEP